MEKRGKLRHKSGETAGKMSRKLWVTVGIYIDIVGKLV